MDYQDFTIDVQSAGDGRFEARVIEAPYFRDRPRVFFSRPIEEADLRKLIGAFNQPPPPEVPARRLGKQLYSAIFSGDLADLFVRCRAALPSGGSAGLRLRIKLQLDDPRAETEYLAALPWEWLFDPRSDTFLATELRNPVVRDVATAQPRTALDVAPPLRILIVGAAPQDIEKLNLEQEIERMREALGPLLAAGQVELRQLGRATLEELRNTLRDEEVHVLHFMGHGSYHAASGAGSVFFVNDAGTMDRVYGEQCADVLKDIPSLRLVVVNACQTACYAGSGATLYYGVASAILERTGVPAVLANQHTISDRAAVAFSRILYHRIAKGDDIDEALTEARLQLKEQSTEWATPVLFLTSRSGRLFNLDPAQSKPPLPRSTDRPLRLGIRSFLGYGHDIDERSDAFLDLAEYFDDRYIKKQEWWQEKIFPELRAFLSKFLHERRPLVLDFAAHSSIAFAAGWVLEPKSGLDVRVVQRITGEGALDWHPKDGSAPEGALWLDRPDVEIDAEEPDTGVDAERPDIALALAVSQPTVVDDVLEHIRRKGLPVGRIVDAAIAPEPGPRSVQGGAHCLRLAQSLLPRLRQRRPHERGGRIHFYCAGPNALVFYLGQLASSLGRVVLYEYPFKTDDAFGKYQRSIELPPPGEVRKAPEGW